MELNLKSMGRRKEPKWLSLETACHVSMGSSSTHIKASSSSHNLKSQGWGGRHRRFLELSVQPSLTCEFRVLWETMSQRIRGKTVSEDTEHQHLASTYMQSTHKHEHIHSKEEEKMHKLSKQVEMEQQCLCIIQNNIFCYFVCVLCLCLHVCEHMSMQCTCMHIYVCWGQKSILSVFLITVWLICWDRVFHWTRSSPIWLGWLADKL